MPGIIQPGFVMNPQQTMVPGIAPVMIDQPGIIIYHNQAYMYVKDPNSELESAKTVNSRKRFNGNNNKL